MDQPFRFDLGKAFGNLCAFLTQGDKLALASTCTLLRNIILRAQNWHEFQLTDYSISDWSKYLIWANKYLDIIQPPSLHILIFDKQHSKDHQLLQLFIRSRPYVKQLVIRTSGEEGDDDVLHCLVADCCRQVWALTIQSHKINETIVEEMLKFMVHVRQFQISFDALSFTGHSLVHCLKNPIQKLVLKPYQLDYESILHLVSSQQLNNLNQFQIDVEQCDMHILSKIIQHLSGISKLRLIHMQNYQQPIVLAKSLSPQIIELTLTKCYHLQMIHIMERVASPSLRKLDLTEAIMLKDDSVFLIAERAINLKWINISWCNQVNVPAVRAVISRCTRLQNVILNGLKSANDSIFEQYEHLKPAFIEHHYDQVRNQYRKSIKGLSQQERGDSTYLPFRESGSNEQMFKQLGAAVERKTLHNLRVLQCNSCNSISDSILKIVYCFNRMGKVINYYGQDLSLFCTNDDEELD